MKLSRRRWLHGTGVGLGLAAMPSVAVPWLAGPRLAQARLSPRENVLEEAKSPFNHIVVAETGDVVTMYFVVDGTYYIESRFDRSHPRSLDLDYTRTMMAGFVLHPGPKRLLMIGLGGGQISNYLFERIPDLEIDAVDIDPEVIRLARKYFGVPDSPRYRTHAADGRLFVEQSPPTPGWDMIMLDAFRGVFVPLHLKTREYYQALRDHMSPRGVVVANLHNATPMYKHDRTTFADAFGQGYAFHTERGRQTIYVASADEQATSTYAMRANARRAQPAFDFDMQGLAARWYLGRDWDDNDVRVLHDDFSKTNLEQGIERHNERCVGSDCDYAYPTR
ncbi:MAG: fused MFS/spermidine synthase [Deltaproteobacteria bacterium]|nr:fused MFS/spermidine synthase [Deltaproteobacteria bacterium]